MITFENFVLRFPEFACTPEPRFDIFLEDAMIAMGIDDGRWGTAYAVAQANLIAHYLTIGTRSALGDKGAAVPVRSKEVDEVAVEYALSREQTNSFDALNATIYGQTYLQWRKTYFSGPRVY